MRGTTVKLLRKWAKSSGADQYATREWWRGLSRPDRERAAAEMRRRLAAQPAPEGRK
jgi:hypothetical protein